MGGLEIPRVTFSSLIFFEFFDFEIWKKRDGFRYNMLPRFTLRPPPQTNPPPHRTFFQFFVEFNLFSIFSLAHEGSPSLYFLSISPHQKCHGREESCARKCVFGKMKAAWSEISPKPQICECGGFLGGRAWKFAGQAKSPPPTKYFPIFWIYSSNFRSSTFWKMNGSVFLF